MRHQEEVKRWTAKRKSALVLEIIQSKKTVAEASRAYDLMPSEIENWVDEGKRGMENALLNKGPSRAARLTQRGRVASLSQLCRCFDVPRRTVYYQPTKAAPKVDEQLAIPIKAMIEENPSFGYRTVAHLLRTNKNTVQRIFQLKGWQVRKRAIGMRPRVQALPSVVKAPNERWSTDLCRVWAGRDGWASLALVIDCYTRELLGWQLSHTGKATTAGSTLEQALIARFGSLCKVGTPLLLRSDNALVFTSRHFTKLTKSYGLQREFITQHCPQQKGMVERAIRKLKGQCVHRHRFESLQHASRVSSDWISFYNHQRPHQALKMKTPAEAFALAA